MNPKKRNVLLAAQRLFIEKGFRSTSVQDIIDEAKISKGTFYNYFSSKNECIVSILENAREETMIKRREIYTNQDRTSKEVLIQQMTVRMNVYREHNLMPLFASIIHSQDHELRDLIKNNYFDEINWLTERLVDVYGEKTKNVATDCAVLMLGMAQQLQHPWINSMASSSIEQLVNFVMRRIDSIIIDMANNDDSLLPASLFDLEKTEDIKTKQQVIEQLEQFYLEEKKNMQMTEAQTIEFILEELSREHPRTFLLEKIIPSLTEAYTGTPIEQKAIVIVYNLWQLIDKSGAEKNE